MKIYEIMREIDECIDHENGEVLDFERLQALTIAKSEKIDNIACLYKNLTAEADAIDREIATLSERKKSAMNRAESLKEFLTTILQGAIHNSARNKITWRRSDYVNITDEKQIPHLYKTETVEVKVNKNDIRAAMKSGEVVDGAELVEKMNIQIK